MTPGTGDFSRAVALPPGLTARAVAAAVAQMEQEWALLDAASRRRSGVSLRDFIAGDEGAATSQVVSRRFVAALARRSEYRRGDPQQFPDLVHRRLGTPLEVKANRYPNPAQGHRPKPGWYLVLRYAIDAEQRPTVVELRIGRLGARDFRRDGGRGRTDRDQTATLRARDLPVWWSAIKHRRRATN